MMFSCLPIGSAHEWCVLRHFVDQYAELHGKRYRVASFPELDRRNTKEPEVLLEAIEDGCRVAIERKSVVQRLDPRYMENHSNEHYLFEHFRRQLDSHGFDYTDTLYCLIFHERDLNGRKRRHVRGIAEQIATTVLRSRERIDESVLGIVEEAPIPWQFRIVEPRERDYTDPDSGIGYSVNLETPFHNSPDKIEEERLGYAKEFQYQADRAAEKFIAYAKCRKLLLVQFFGHAIGEVGDKEIIEIVKSAQLPAAIDEVWVAREEWVDLDESQIVWQWVR